MAHTSSAFAPKLGNEPAFVTVGRDARAHTNTTWSSPTTRTLTGWTAMWDRDTNVPLRLYGKGISAPGSVANAATAEAVARRFLADHLDVLAPGATVSDFVLVSNELGVGNDLRTVGFEQHVDGLRVLGGTIGFGFKGDHLTMISSTALPNAKSSAPHGRLSDVSIAANAITWLAGSGHAVRARSAAGASLVGTPGEVVVLPIVHERGRLVDVEYHTVESVVVETTAGTRGVWQVYVDASTGAPIARANRLESFTGTIEFDTTDQSPSQPRSNKVAPFVTATINGQSVTADINGLVTYTGANPATVSLSTTGSFVAVTDVSQTVATGTGSLTANGNVVFSEATVPFSDAELDAYIAANRAKMFVRAKLNPQLEWLNQQLSVNVNDASDSCNAYSTGDDVHFFVTGAIPLPDGTNGTCENTGRMADVVSHETGHSVHNNSVIQGQGAFPPTDGQSEGLADTLAISITGDHGLGRGFFVSADPTENVANTPLRDVQPAVPKTWPVASGEVHDEGEILGESLWDLRLALQTKLGTEAGFTQLLKIYYTIMQRSPTIPAAYAEALVGDDDDGDLSNGTPNKCEIDAAFARHNLGDVSGAIGITEPTRDSYTITVPPISSKCASAGTISGATVAWHVGSGADAVVTLANGATGFTGAIPTQPDGTTISYQVVVTVSTGTTLTFPNNPADPYYEFYVGAVTNIYCEGFESGFDSWTHRGAEDEWQVGTPMGIGGDPTVAHTGTGAAGIDLGQVANSDGLYETSANESLVSPKIPLTAGQTVHLQYWRWLGVEDAEFDQATISANGSAVWVNKTTGTSPDGADEVNHVDQEWVFEDIDLTKAIGSGSDVQLTFNLTSDEGLNLGGWNLDDVCVVAIAANASLCGNGVVDPGETCDDGNTTSGDGCSSTCQTETPTMGGDKDGGGCCSVGGSPAGSAALALLTLGLVIRRRRKNQI